MWLSFARNNHKVHNAFTFLLFSYIIIWIKFCNVLPYSPSERQVRGTVFVSMPGDWIQCCPLKLVMHILYNYIYFRHKTWWYCFAECGHWISGRVKSTNCLLMQDKLSACVTCTVCINRLTKNTILYIKLSMQTNKHTKVHSVSLCPMLWNKSLK